MSAKTPNALVLQAFSTKEFAFEVREKLLETLTKEMDRTITRTMCTYILAVYDEGMANVFPETRGTNKKLLGDKTAHE